MSVLVKICGLTRPDDVQAAVALGADVLGFVLAESPRRLTPEQVKKLIRDLPARVRSVGVLVDCPPEQVREIRAYCGLDMVQLHGQESEEQVAQLGQGVIKGLGVNGLAPRADSYPTATLLLDALVKGRSGGLGKTFDWSLAVELARQRPIILAGGLNPGNVKQAIDTVRPFAVDVSSGVESAPGRKDHVKLAEFIRLARQAGQRA